MKTLFLDLETFPLVAFVWGRYDQNIIRVTQESCIATYAAKWLGEPRVFTGALPDYKNYKPGSYDDSRLVKDLWKLVDEADIIVAHNGDDFDFKVCNARFLYHKLSPPTPYKTVDTKKAIKKVARLSSNKLDDIGQYLDLGKKIKTDFDLWEGCINGDPGSWKQMLAYNKKDILLLESLYLQLLPWIVNHPNRVAEIGGIACPKCGSKNIQYRGYAVSSTRKYRRFQCLDCAGWARTTKSEPFGAKAVNCV